MVYPEQLDLPDEVLTALGSFWSNTDRDPLTKNLISARLLQDRHALGLLDDYRNSFSRQKCPLLMKQEALLVRLRESDRSTADSLYRFDDPNLFFDGSFNYGQFNKNVFSWSLPDGLIDVALIIDRLDGSTISWFGGVDYNIVNSKLIFAKNPFNEPGAPVNDIIDAGVVVDRELWVWFWGCRSELHYLYNFYGYAVGLPTVSTPTARRAVNGVYDAITKTNTISNTIALLSAITDSGFAIRDGEVVENVFYSATELTIVTSDQVYRGNDSATATVAVGDVLRSGQSLTSAVIVNRLNHGFIDSVFPYLEIQPEWLDISSPPLLVGETSVPVRTTVNTDTGFLEVEFDLSANDDVFWAEVRKREVAQGISLAKMMLGLTVDDPEPAAGMLPATISPLRWVMDNFLRNAIAVTIFTGQLGKNSLPLTNLSRLRHVSAPHIWYIVQIICDVNFDGYTIPEPDVSTMDFVEVSLTPWVSEEPDVTIENTGVDCR